MSAYRTVRPISGPMEYFMGLPIWLSSWVLLSMDSISIVGGRATRRGQRAASSEEEVAAVDVI